MSGSGLCSRSRSRSRGRSRGGDSQEVFWKRLRRFFVVCVDGDGHSVLKTDFLLDCARSHVPELESDLSSLEREHAIPGGNDDDDDGGGYRQRVVKGIDSLELHVFVHTCMCHELVRDATLCKTGIELGELTCLGRGFRAREVVTKLTECFELLEASTLD